MANQWFRMYSEFATDPKVQMMSESDQRRFIMVLCMRCSNDDVTLHDEEVAFQLRISNEQWAATKAVFIAKNLLNEDNTPTAWDKRQFVSDSSAERVAKHRAKKKQACNVTETPPEADTDTDTEADTEVNQQRASTEFAGGTQAGMVCARLKAECRIPGVNPQHPKLIALLDAGLTPDEFVSAGMDANGKGFGWVLATAEGRRRDAAAISSLPNARASPSRRGARQTTGRQAAIDNYAAEAAAARGDFNERTVANERDITGEAFRVA